MIQKNGKRIVFSDDTAKTQREALKAETVKHKGKSIASLTKKELENALSAALKLLGMADDQDVIK